MYVKFSTIAASLVSLLSMPPAHSQIFYSSGWCNDLKSIIAKTKNDFASIQGKKLYEEREIYTAYEAVGFKQVDPFHGKCEIHEPADDMVAIGLIEKSLSCWDSLATNEKPYKQTKEERSQLQNLMNFISENISKCIGIQPSFKTKAPSKPFLEIDEMIWHWKGPKSNPWELKMNVFIAIPGAVVNGKENATRIRTELEAP